MNKDSFFRTSSLAVLGILLIAIVFGACSDDDGGDDTIVGSGENTPSTGEEAPPEVPEGAVEVRLRDFEIEMPDSAPAGEITFVITNEGPSTHDFIILETDLAADSLPQNELAQVDLEAEGVTEVDGIQQVPYDEFDVLTTTLPQGDYVVICNVAGHYEQGMYTTFTAE